MAQQQNQSKLGSMKPTKISKGIKPKEFGTGFGGEHPMPGDKKATPIKQSDVKAAMKKANKAPSHTKVMKSVKKTMGYK